MTRNRALLIMLVCLLTAGAGGCASAPEEHAEAKPEPSTSPSEFVRTSTSTERLPVRMEPERLFDALERRGCQLGSVDYVEGRQRSGLRIKCARDDGSLWDVTQ